jgi:Uma2 family endonuclease
MGIAKKEIVATRIYTHEDLETFPEGEIWELLEGVPYQMAPPSNRHQRIATELIRQFANYLIDKNHPCEVFPAPFGVYLPNTKKKNNFVSPDLTLVCDEIGDDKYYGVPALVIEIISPSNTPSEQQKKFEIYQTVGIREYWIIYPDVNKVSMFELNQNHRYELINTYDWDEETEYFDEAKIKVERFDDLRIDFKLVFSDKKATS